MIKAILFDMDGVLVDSHDAWVYVFNKSLKKFEGREVTVEEFDNKIWSIAFDQTAKKYFKAPIQEIRDYYSEIYGDYKKRLKLMKNVKETLFTLKSKGIKLVVVSNTQKRVIERLLRDISLFEYFDLCLGGDSVEKGKPEPDILYKALELLKINKDEALFVGDTKYDRMAAEKAGIKFIGFRIDGDNKINDLKELTKVLRNKVSCTS